ncbi:MAG TPA: serine protease [Alphaproteobacteria bacterium]|nr:serine protease [Alphaproteobacteria bacterium]
MDKWKKSVVHLECATDSEHIYDRIKRIDSLREEMDEGKIDREHFAKLISDKSRDIRYHGTAIFLVHGSRRYIVSARHVLWDKYSAKREYQEELDRTQERQSQIPEILREYFDQRYEDNIFNIIFRVPSLDEVLQPTFDHNRSFLMNLGAGTSFTVPYTFSKPVLDLAIVSLDQRDSRFGDELIRLGYDPIATEELGLEPSQEGAEVFTVGYPSSTALLGQTNQPAALTQWSSSYFSLPSFSFGRVSMLHDELPFFWADMSIYPGNSGCPVIENNKIVGIVSSQPTIPVEESEKFRTRIPFGKIIKAKFIADLISIQEQKDSNTL